ncbi:MAG: hypothetical protein QM601_08605, partial [Pseudoxanthomonas sp.]
MTALRLLAPGLLLAALPAWSPLRAQETAIYRCTDAGGQTTVQNAPCAKGLREEKRMMQGVPSRPSGTNAANATTTATTPTDTPATGLPSLTVPAASSPPRAATGTIAPAVATPTLPAPPRPSGPASVIYRCTDTAGRLTVQNTPCPKGMREQKQRVQAAPTASLATSTSTPAPNAPADPAAPAPPPAAADVPGTPPAGTAAA